jgi:hypothetical protein
MAESDFSELLHAAEQLSAEVEGSGDLPKVERTLRQVLEASTELWSRVTQTGAQDVQAYVPPLYWLTVTVRLEAGIILRLPRKQAGNNLIVPYHGTLLLGSGGIDSDNFGNFHCISLCSL